MRSGTWIESKVERHVELRARVLSGQATRFTPLRTTPVDDVEHAVEHARLALGRAGVALVDLPAPLTIDELIAFGERFGRVMPETHPSVQDRVERGVVLNLVREHAATRDVELQPFSTDSLLMHTEHSLRPVAAQPRTIVLSCVVADAADADAMTVVSPTEAVLDRLAPSERELLEGLYLKGAPAPILRTEGLRQVLAFRDFGPDALAWTHSADVDPVAVGAAVSALVASVYEPATLRTVSWRPGRLLLVDNWAVLHGRTASLDQARPRPRHLQRVRIAGS